MSPTRLCRSVELIVQEGETIRGQLSCAPNSRNNRDLDIVIDWEVEGQEPSKGSMTYKMCVLAGTDSQCQQLNAGHKLRILSHTFPPVTFCASGIRLAD